MNRVVLAVVLSTGLIATGAVSASAASTRAEYIAQVDPIWRGVESRFDSSMEAIRQGRQATQAPHGWERPRHDRDESGLVRREAAGDPAPARR
jgi:hypothetical protein